MSILNVNNHNMDKHLNKFLKDIQANLAALDQIVASAVPEDDIEKDSAHSIIEVSISKIITYINENEGNHSLRYD